MTTLIRTAIRYRSLTMFAVFLVMIVGIFSYIQLPQNEDPPHFTRNNEDLHLLAGRHS